MNPGNVLPAGADAAAGEEAERPHHLRERAAGPLEDDAGAQQDQPGFGARGAARFRFPVDTELREKVVPGSGVLGLRLVA